LVNLPGTELVSVFIPLYCKENQPISVELSLLSSRKDPPILWIQTNPREGKDLKINMKM